MDIDQLIQKIVSHAVTEGKKTVLEQLYREEKILRPASKLPRYLPEVYRQMAALATDREAIFRSEAWIFCRQGQFMAEHTEEEGDLQTPFSCFFPTYRLMNPAQLRAYFTWRTKLRQGICEPVSTSYAFVYIYELLNQIGVADPADGFEKLRRFRENYAPIDPKIERYLTTWMRDYRIYYGLLPDESAAEDDGALTALMHAADTPDDTLFSAICRFSSYDFFRSRAYKAHPKECAALLCRVYRDFAAFCDTHRKRSLFERLFGAKVTMSYPMFRSAVFWERGSQPDRTVKCGEREEYTCKNGLWSRTGYVDKPDKNRELGRMVKAVDCHLREVYSLPPLTLPDGVSKQFCALIARDAAEVIVIKPPVPEMVFDLSKLSRIRRAADETRDSLLVDDTQEPAEAETAKPEEPPTGAPAEKLPAEPPPAAAQSEAGLTEQEQHFLRALLSGMSAAAAGREAGGFPALLADAVNEKLYDEFADTVLGVEDGEPVILPDYREELERMVAP